MDDLEKVARALCEIDGCHPDTIACYGMAPIIGRGRGYMVNDPRPAWRFYLTDAMAALRAMGKITDPVDKS